MLQLVSVSKQYKKSIVLDSVSHTFDTGTTVVIGPSGAGKSTLLRLCATQEKISDGQIKWDGNPIYKNLKQFRRILGYAPQLVDLPEDISAYDFMLHIGALKNIKREQCVQQTKLLFERLGIRDSIYKLIGTYSGGMRRRLVLAQSLLGNPKCLIIDEPTAELDTHTATMVNDLILEKSKHAVVIMTTHLQSSLKDYSYSSFEIPMR